MKNSIGKVIESSPISILIEISNNTIFETNKKDIQIGNYLEIQDGNLNTVICVIQNIKSSMPNDLNNDLKFVLSTQPVGYIEEGRFSRGASLIPSPTEPVYIIQEETLKLMFNPDKDFNFPFGKIVQNKIIYNIDANKFFSKHIAIVTTVR